MYIGKDDLVDFYMWMIANDYNHNIRARVEKKAKIFLTKKIVKNNVDLADVSVSDYDYPYIVPPNNDKCIHPLDQIMFWNDGTIECKKCGMRSVTF